MGTETENWKNNLEQGIINGDICTDSDLEDFAMTNEIPERAVFEYVAYLHAKGTPCEGCKHYAAAYPSMYPCNNCTRCRQDYYTKG